MKRLFLKAGLAGVGVAMLFLSYVLISSTVNTANIAISGSLINLTLGVIFLGGGVILLFLGLFR